MLRAPLRELSSNKRRNVGGKVIMERVRHYYDEEDSVDVRGVSEILMVLEQFRAVHQKMDEILDILQTQTAFPVTPTQPTIHASSHAPSNRAPNCSPPDTASNPAATHTFDPHPSFTPLTPSTPTPAEKRKRDFVQLTADEAKKFKMSRETRTIPELLEEWYVSTANMPSVQEREHLYWWSWRQGPELAFYKKRKAIVVFIENLPSAIALENPTRGEIGELLERYRTKKGLGIQALSLLLKPAKLDAVYRELEEMLGEKSDA